jgi:hypothetical protein
MIDLIGFLCSTAAVVAWLEVSEGLGLHLVLRIAASFPISWVIFAATKSLQS